VSDPLDIDKLAVEELGHSHSSASERELLHLASVVAARMLEGSTELLLRPRARESAR
jgi:hypothetical protein